VKGLPGLKKDYLVLKRTTWSVKGLPDLKRTIWSMKGLPGLHERTTESVKGLPILKKTQPGL